MLCLSWFELVMADGYDLGLIVTTDGCYCSISGFEVNTYLVSLLMKSYLGRL